MKRTTTLLTVIIMIIALLCGCQDDDDKPTISLIPCLLVSFNSYEEFAQSIIDGWFFDQGSSIFRQHIAGAGYDRENELDIAVKEKMATTSVIKPIVNGEELGWYADGKNGRHSYLNVYYPYERRFQQSFNQGYTAYHLFQDSELGFNVEYSFDVASNEDFPQNEKANYDAVINGKNVKIDYVQNSTTGRCFGMFQYKDMYEVTIVTENKKQFDIVFSNLTIKEIRVT